MNNIIFKNNKVIIKKQNHKFTKEGNIYFPFFIKECNNILLSEFLIDFFEKFCIGLIKINLYKLTTPKILLGAKNKNKCVIFIKNILKNKAKIKTEEDIKKFKIDVKENYCTMGLFINESRHQITLNLIGANGINLHDEQMSKLRFFCENEN